MFASVYPLLWSIMQRNWFIEIGHFISKSDISWPGSVVLEPGAVVPGRENAMFQQGVAVSLLGIGNSGVGNANSGVGIGDSEWEIEESEHGNAVPEGGNANFKAGISLSQARAEEPEEPEPNNAQHWRRASDVGYET